MVHVLGERGGRGGKREKERKERERERERSRTVSKIKMWKEERMKRNET